MSAHVAADGLSATDVRFTHAHVHISIHELAFFLLTRTRHLLT